MAGTTKRKPTGNYPVGYCAPPIHTRWARGQSGNSKGRPSDNRIGEGEGVELLRSIGRSLLTEITLTINGKRTRMRVVDAFAHKLVTDAVMGNGNARRELLRIIDFVREVDGVPKVINAKLVFEEEENRMMQLASENRDLLAQLEAERAKRG